MIARSAYLCGPTVHQDPHLGNYKTFYKSLIDFYNTKSKGDILLLNLTDMGDKVYQKANSIEFITLHSHINKVIRNFIQGLKILHLRPWALDIKRTSFHVKCMRRVLRELTTKWTICHDSTGLYPTQQSFTTFYLWRTHEKYPLYKFNREVMGGIPGWHLECAALIDRYVRSNFIHYGGVDLKPIHHCNQSLIIKALGNFNPIWRHTQPIVLTNSQSKQEKMSKSLSNEINLPLEQPKAMEFIRDWLSNCSMIKKTYLDPNEFDRSLNSYLKSDSLNLRKRCYHKYYRYLRIRHMFKQRGQFRRADFIRKELLKNYNLRDLSPHTLLFSN
jgi:cysteinyl-tRNA synthetase